MKRTIMATVLGAVLLTMPVASAGHESSGSSGSGGSGGNGDVIREGQCSRSSDWKLKLSPEDGRTEIEFEVDQNVVGHTWRIRLQRDGAQVFTGRRTTRGPSGSFELRVVRSNPGGPDHYRARAVNLRTGERCLGVATI